MNETKKSLAINVICDNESSKSCGQEGVVFSLFHKGISILTFFSDT